MIIAPFAFGVIACLAAQGVIFVFALFIAAVVSAVKRPQLNTEPIHEINTDTIPDRQK